MYDILKLSEEEQRTIFRNTAQKMGVQEAIVEKDYWVCLVLDYLFRSSKYRRNLAFKGGTSLSKCFGLIKRFSEDIDLILDWRLLGYEIDEPWQERSKTKQDKFNKEANAKTETFLANDFLPAIRADLSEVIGKAANVEISPAEPHTVNFHYPLLYNAQSVTQSIRLETGTLAAWTPSIRKTVTPYIFEYNPRLKQTVSASVITTSAERTFWEKATILHHEANRPENLEMPTRYSRHYYDLYCIGQTEYKAKALKQRDLLDKVVAFKVKFYPRAWAKYEETALGSIKLLPPSFRFDALRRDYEIMGNMMFGEHPTFDELMGAIADLENEIN